ncbi:MAG TPA: ABC transporter substrate-binding protein [Candidatus Thermoplasmatota archaeon]|nr:ABC transporter substrate-binding protein [Candidatus Thermoplasmatota archaeon]
MRRTAQVALPLALLLVAALAGCAGANDSGGLRLGYFPNVTHAQALYGIQAGLYAKELGALPFTPVQFNAGPNALEALLSGHVDATYVGPGPTINALAQTGSDVLRVIAGAASGGARFIVRGDVAIGGDGDLGGKTFATPQLGNTQDLSLKDWLRQHGHTTTDRGGDVQVLNAANPDILTLFVQKQVHGAWVPEPWAARLVADGGGRELLDERSLWPDGKFSTTLLVTTGDYLGRHPDRVRALLEAHIQATDAVQAGNASALQAVNDGIRAATGKALSPGLLAESFTKLNFTNDPLAATLAAFGEKARGLGLLHGTLPPLPQSVALGPLNEVLARHGRAGVALP